MKKYVIYDKEGNILSFGIHSNQTFEDLQQQGKRIIEVSSLSSDLDLTHKIVDGKVVDK